VEAVRALPASLARHRIRHRDVAEVTDGRVEFTLRKGLWFLGMAAAAIIGGALTFTPGALALYVATTAIVLLFGHSLGSHRKLIHDSFQCPRWLEYTLVYLGVQVGLAGPLGLLKQHELRDYAQRLPICHDYLRHGRESWRDAWWQLVCELKLAREPDLVLEPRIANDRFYLFLERTWMWQHLPWALLFYAWGGWSFVFWGVCARVTTGVFGHWVIGFFAHNHGEMHHVVDGAAVQGRNVRWTSLLTMGESWHNNHHAFPGSAKLGLNPGEWDPGWWVLSGLSRFGLVWNLRLPEHLAARPELRALPETAATSKKTCRFCPARTAPV
jgi:fatty-acid desaturase